MTTVSIEESVAKDLLETKLRVLDQKIEIIFQRWGIRSIAEFIEGAKTGKFEEAESDAIEVQNLTDKRQQIEKLLFRK